MIISKTIEIDMGHRLPNHKSKCFNIHGHRYKIKVAVNGLLVDKKGSSDEGMVVDFGDLKKIMLEEIDDVYDHGFVMYKIDPMQEYFVRLRKVFNQKIIFVDFVPTAENLAKHWYQILEKRLKEINIEMSYIKVWETPTSTAVYAGEKE